MSETDWIPVIGIDKAADEQWNPRFKTGDMVRLKSGGPLMTVDGVKPRYTTYWFRCKWFAGRHIQEAEFERDALVRVED